MSARAWAFWIGFILLVAATPALAQAFRTIPGARRLARPGAAHVRLEVRASDGFGCGGGGCNGGVETRNIRGRLPASDLSYFYSDRPGQEPGCPALSSRESFFSEWTEIEIAPAREEHVSCGIGMMVGERMEEWVILRARRARAQ